MNRSLPAGYLPAALITTQWAAARVSLFQKYLNALIPSITSFPVSHGGVVLPARKKFDTGTGS
ncbi:MAG: hypothetical protein ABI878_11600 [Acidobacteriota bacterium]